MSLFVAQNHQDFSSIFKTRVHREYDNINCIINESKSEIIDKNDLENVHCFLLNEFSHE
jgi:dsDNA-binding SOS-regulon protein